MQKNVKKNTKMQIIHLQDLANNGILYRRQFGNYRLNGF